MTDDLETKDQRRKKYQTKRVKPRNPFARALYEDTQYRQKIKEVRKKDRLRPQDVRRILEDEDDV